MTYAMNELLSFSVNLLSAAQAWGGVATLLLFAFSFIAVHAVKLASKGYLLYKEEEKKKEDAFHFEVGGAGVSWEEYVLQETSFLLGQVTRNF